MPMWVWIAIGLGSYFSLSIVVAFALARILFGTIGRQSSELHETEMWTSAAPTRAAEDAGDALPEEVRTKGRRVIRLR